MYKRQGQFLRGPDDVQRGSHTQSGRAHQGEPAPGQVLFGDVQGGDGGTAHLAVGVSHGRDEIGVDASSALVPGTVGDAYPDRFPGAQHLGRQLFQAAVGRRESGLAQSAAEYVLGSYRHGPVRLAVGAHHTVVLVEHAYCEGQLVERRAHERRRPVVVRRVDQHHP